MAGVLRESVEELGNAMPYILDQAEFLDCKNNGWRPTGISRGTGQCHAVYSRPGWISRLKTMAGVLRESGEELGNAMPYILDQAEQKAIQGMTVLQQVM